MIRQLSRLIFMIMVFLTTSCIKETYNMNKLSEKVHLTPTIAISAIKGDISLSDLVKSGDTVVFDQNNFVKIIFKKDSVIDLKIADFYDLKNMIDLNGNDKVSLDLKLLNPGFDYVKGFSQLIATIKPETLNFEIEDILSHITGDFVITNPSIKINYSNSFINPIQIKLNVTGKRKTKTLDLDLATFPIEHPVDTNEPDVYASFTIDKNNSSLPELISIPPEEIYFSGTATMNPSGKNSQKDNFILDSSRLLGSLEVEVPLEFLMNNIQFTDTLDNFMKDDEGSDDSPVKPENFELLRVDITAKNGFPLGVSLKMSLYDSGTQGIKDTISAKGILKPAPVDSEGRANGITETTTSIEFTRKFFSSISKADKIIFQFTLNTTGNSSVKIYSDYRIDFNAALVLKPGININ